MHAFKVLHSVIDLAGATEGLKQVLSGAAHDLGEAAVQRAPLGVGAGQFQRRRVGGGSIRQPAEAEQEVRPRRRSRWYPASFPDASSASTIGNPAAVPAVRTAPRSAPGR